MAEQDYTVDPPDGPGEIIRGAVWPPAGDPLTVQITNTGGWAPGAEDQDWGLLLSRTRRGTTPDLKVAAYSAVEVAGVMTLLFRISAAQTASLPAGKGRYYVEVMSEWPGGTTTPGGPPEGPSFYDCVAGVAMVRNAAGEG